MRWSPVSWSCRWMRACRSKRRISLVTLSPMNPRKHYATWKHGWRNRTHESRTLEGDGVVLRVCIPAGATCCGPGASGSAAIESRAIDPRADRPDPAGHRSQSGRRHGSAALFRCPGACRRVSGRGGQSTRRTGRGRHDGPRRSAAARRGGGALLHRAGEDAVHAYDGRETAPAAARPDRFIRNGEVLDFAAAVDSGLSVGTPGLVRMLADMHADHGRLPWPELFAPAIRLATEGFAVSPRMHALVQGSKGLKASPSAAPYFYDESGQPRPVGYVLRNEKYARVLERLAQEGADAFYRGELAEDMVQAVADHVVAGDLSLHDLGQYRAIRREAVCAQVDVYRYYGMPPPSS